MLYWKFKMGTVIWDYGTECWARGAFPPHLGADKVLQVMTLIEGYCAQHVGLDAKRMPAAGSRFESRSLGRVVCCECCSSSASKPLTALQSNRAILGMWMWMRIWILGWWRRGAERACSGRSRG